ncbi:MAG: hypothetical protein RL398_1066 [Planctomycetota bacterium]
MTTWRIVTELPVDVAAAIVAESVVGVLPTFEPEPHRPGATVRSDAEGYRVELVDFDGRLLLVGDRRLRIMPPTGLDAGVVVRSLDATLLGGGATFGSVRLRPVGPGVEIVGSLPTELSARLELACRSAIATASDRSQRIGGGLPANLSALLATRLLADARTCEPSAAAALLRNAVGLGARGSAIHLHLAAHERADGRTEGARRSEFLAVMAANDPRARADAARACRGELDAVGLRELAREAHQLGDLTTAAALLHSARRMGNRAGERLVEPLWDLNVPTEQDSEVARAERLLARERATDRRLGSAEPAASLAAPPR